MLRSAWDMHGHMALPELPDLDEVDGEDDEDEDEDGDDEDGYGYGDEPAGNEMRGAMPAEIGAG